MEFNLIEQLQNHNSLTSWLAVFAIAAGFACLVGWFTIKVMRKFVPEVDVPEENITVAPNAIESYRGQLINQTDSNVDFEDTSSVKMDKILSRLQRLSSRLETLSARKDEILDLTPEEYAAGLDLEFIQRNEA
ncbi:MAG: hypothetical protein GY752_09320 [bacterium]|nr:hypothetical protein [bacterium]